MLGQCLHRSASAWVLAALVVVAGAANAASISRLDARVGGVAGLAVAAPEFVARSAWVEDQGANGDGVASPGERVHVRLRMQNAGADDARNLTMTLGTDDPDIDLPESVLVSPRWQAGVTTSVAWRVTVAPTAAPHLVTATATFAADNGGPWRFILTFPIAAAPVHFIRVDDRIEDPVPDGDGDGAAEPGERVRLGVRLRNDGAIDGVGVRVGLQTLDPDVSPVVAEAIHTSWPARAERDTVFLVDIAGSALSHSASMFITVTVDGVEPWQFSTLIPIVGRDPEFEFRSSWLFDPAPGGNRDGLATPGERVLPRLRLRNVGTGDARDVAVTLSTSDPDVVVMQGQVTHATWPAGAARNNNGFVLDIAPDATAHDAMFVASVTAADGGTWQFSVPFAIAAPRIDIVHRRSWLFDPEPGGNRDGNANPGERVLPVVRLLNSGPSTALNVLVALEFDDPSVTVIRGAMSRARWEPGAAFTHSGFAIRIAHGSTPHDVTATLRVSADNGGPWDFPFVFPIAYRPVEFAQRNAWIFDPAPGGDGDGEMEAGERVFPRFRLRNIGVDEGRNVIVRLLTHDRHATVVAGEVTHASWPAGEARNNDGFVVEIDPLSESHDVEFIVKVEADGGVSRVFAYTFAITTPPVHIAVQRAALLDRGNYNGIVEPGEGVWPQFRLRHTGSQPATGLRATLIATDDDITITRADASRGTLNPGVVWEIKFLRMRTAADAIPHDTAIALIVTADSGGPWRFDVPMQLGADFGIRVRSAASADPAPGGNANGQTNPGETVELRIVVANDSLMQLDNVQTTITVDDPDVTVTGGVDPVAEWPRGSEHNRTFVFPAEVAPDARSHSVPVVVTMAADGMEPVSHTWDFSIVALPPDFELRNAWVWEPTPAGNGDGDVNPGERVFPRVRLRNVGAGPGQIVQASLVVLDPDVDIVSGFVTHDSWPVGEARNNNGLVLDISPDATPHDVTVVLSVVADDAGPWGFSFTMPIVAAQVETTALLANFPNPFNPETWIPFDLSEAAEVTVTVYDARGMLVRRLDLGRLPSGVYRGRSTAAYWDGRNDIGEQVSSGAYIYELRAGAHREMRRMIVRK